MAILVTGATGLVGLAGQRVELTGPQSLSHEAMVSIIGSVLGRSLRFAEIPPAAAIEGMTAAGLPREFVTALMQRYARHQDKPQHPANGAVAGILGRPARTYAEWVASNAAAFRGAGE